MFKNPQFINGDKLNQAGQGLYSLIVDICNDPEKKQDFYNNVKGIYVTSQDRPDSNSHVNGMAIDIYLEPAGMNLWLFNELRKYSNTIYISGHNKHLHFDLREEGLTGIEIKPDGKNIKIYPVSPYANYLFGYYEGHKLTDFKIKLLTALSMPFSGWTKIGQKARYETEKVYEEKIKPIFNKIIIGVVAVGGIIIYSKLKK